MELLDIGNIALDQGLSPRAAMAAMAVAKTEGGLNGEVGDYGQSFGPFQFYTGGQLKNFARDMGVSLAEAGHLARYQPEKAAAWALRPGGYLGDALRNAERQGISGAALATYAQRHGQVSVSPERAGQNYDWLWGDYDPGAGAGPSSVAGANQPTAAASSGTAWASPQDLWGGFTNAIGNMWGGATSNVGNAWGNLVGAAVRPSQFAMNNPNNQLLSPAEAQAWCGPDAAMTFAASYGRTPTLGEAKSMASQVGWNATAGMAGPQSESQLLSNMGVPNTYSAWGGTPDWSRVQNSVSSGNPVILSTPKHYFYATGYDPTSGAYNVGTSGTDLRVGGSEWMTPGQMAAAPMAGAVQGGIFASGF